MCWGVYGEGGGGVKILQDKVKRLGVFIKFVICVHSLHFLLYLYLNCVLSRNLIEVYYICTYVQCT